MADDVETHYMLVRPGGGIHTEFLTDEDDALTMAAGYDPAWGVIPVYVPPVRVEEEEPEPAPKRSARSAKKTPEKTPDKGEGGE